MLSGNECFSLWPTPLPKEYQVLFFVILLVLALFTIIANGILLYSLYKTNQLTSITGKLIFLMNISDLLSGIIAYPFAAAMFFVDYAACIVKLGAQFITFLFAYMSFFMLFGVAIDRYLHVTKLNKYQMLVNEFRMKIYITISVVMSIAISLVSTIFSSSFPLKVVLNSINVITIIQMLLIYSMISRQIDHHSRNVPQSNISTRQNRQQTRQRFSGTRTIRIVVIMMLVLFMPYNVTSMFWSYYKLQKREKPGLLLNVLESFSFMIIFLNTGVNAIIYGYGNSTTRNYIAGMFKGQASIIAISSRAHDEGEQQQT
eukprot:gene7785-8630_t